MDRRRWLLSAVTLVIAMGVAVFVMALDEDGSGTGVAARDTTLTSESTTTTSAEAATGTSEAVRPTTEGSTTTAVPPPTTTAQTPAAPFQSSVEPVTAAQLGSSWHPDMGCAAPEQLRAVNVSHWGYDGEVHLGRLVVAAEHADRMVAVLRDIYEARFPIERMAPIDVYGGDDQASMRANNTSGFNCRYVAGTTKLSQHAFGRAVDVNPLVNPYVKGSTVDPPEGAQYADRSRNDPGMIQAGDAVVDAFARQGWSWGGYWSGGQDYQHFSASGG